MAVNHTSPYTFNRITDKTTSCEQLCADCSWLQLYMVAGYSLQQLTWAGDTASCKLC